VKSEEYKNKNLKSEYYDKLVSKLKEIEPAAVRILGKKKWNQGNGNELHFGLCTKCLQCHFATIKF
jgi:hypothetical protein